MNKLGSNKQSIDESLAVPLYHQVYLILREYIRSGLYPVGSVLPSETSLCEEFAVSRITVRRAMRELANSGVIVRQRGKGTFVSENENNPLTQNALDDLVQNVQAIGELTEVQHIASEKIGANSDIADRLSIRFGDLVLKSSQIRLSKGEPLSVIITYVPENVAKKLQLETEKQPMLVRLIEAGVSVGHANQDVTATLAEPAIAVQLGIEVGSPLLKLTRLVFDDADNPVEWLTALYRADRYAIKTTLSHETIGQQSGWHLT
ncbi:MAG: GntR family transcriptional regulator [Rhodospirillaceae bacterium]